jgi:hypothetical protein
MMESLLVGLSGVFVIIYICANKNTYKVFVDIRMYKLQLEWAMSELHSRFSRVLYRSVIITHFISFLKECKVKIAWEVGCFMMCNGEIYSVENYYKCFYAMNITYCVHKCGKQKREKHLQA